MEDYSEKDLAVWNPTLQGTMDGGFLSLGYILDAELTGMLLKYNREGDTIWMSKYHSYFYPEDTFINPYDFFQKKENEIITLNQVSSPGPSQGAIWLNQLDTLGNILWEKLIDTEYSDRPRSQRRPPDRGLAGGQQYFASGVPQQYLGHPHG